MLTMDEFFIRFYLKTDIFLLTNPMGTCKFAVYRLGPDPAEIAVKSR
jgi:hypothetical protein